jgi:hypothetical protein
MISQEDTETSIHKKLESMISGEVKLNIEKKKSKLVKKRGPVVKSPF